MSKHRKKITAMYNLNSNPKMPFKMFIPKIKLSTQTIQFLAKIYLEFIQKVV
jgi:hypothetical protein